MTKDQRLKFQRILALVFALAITLVLYLNRDKVQDLEGLGYPGIFLFSLLSNATLILPLPGVLFTSAMGAVFNPFWVAVAAGSGAALGEISGYLAGYSGQGLVERTAWSQRVEGWMRKYGSITVLLLAFIPNPLFDIAGITAGILKMPLQIFLFWCVIGKILKMLVFALGGSFILSRIPWFQ